MKTFAAIAIAALICVPQMAQAGWMIEVVSGTGIEDVGSHPSLAFDLAGNPCISFRDESNDNLQLTCRTGSTWSSLQEIVDDDLYVGYYSALILDGGIDHVAYRQGSDVYSELRHAERIGGGTWSITSVDHAAQGVGHGISMDLDSSGYPHISHSKRWGQEAIRYSHWTGSSWVSGTILKQGAEDTAIVIWNDRPLIAFAGAYLGLAEPRGKKWKVTTIDPDSAEAVSLAVESEILHAVYSSYGSESMSLRHRYWSEGAGWSPHVIIDQPLEYTPDISLAIHASESSPELHVTYYDQANGALRYAHGSASGPWTTDVVDTFGDAGLYSSVAVDEAGNPHIAYYDSANGDLRYAAFSATCTTDGGCDDQNACTSDTCGNDGKCSNTPLDGDCTLGGADGICCGGTCTLPVCINHDDCFDFGADTCVEPGDCANTCESGCVDDDGFCPSSCGTPSKPDSDCPACDVYENRKSCNADPRCKWSNQSKYCYLN